MKHNDVIQNIDWKNISFQSLIYPGSRTEVGMPVLQPGNLLSKSYQK